MGENNEDLNVYLAMKLAILSLTSALLIYNVIFKIDDLTSLISTFLMYVCSTALAFYGKDSFSTSMKKRRKHVVISSIFLVVLLFFLMAISHDIEKFNITIIVCKVIFSMIPIVPLVYSTLDYSEENPKTKKVSARMKKTLKENKTKEEENKFREPQEKKGINRKLIKREVEKNERKNKE